MKPLRKNWTRRSWIFLAVFLALVVTVSIVAIAADQGDLFNGFAAQQQESEEAPGVVLVPIEYRGDQWMLADPGVRILGCEPPASFSKPHESGPLVRFLDQNGEQIYEYQLQMDPRIILHEGPSRDPFLLDEVSLVMRIPLSGEPAALELYASPDPVGTPEEKELVLRVDLKEAMARFQEQGGRKGSCDEPVFLPDALQK